MSFVTLSDGDIEERRALSTALIDYFYTHLDEYAHATKLSMHTELFEYIDQDEFVGWLRYGGVGRQIYSDIETKAETFNVGSLGSMWFDKEYEDDSKTKKRVLRVGLIPMFNASDYKESCPSEYDKTLVFSFNVDVLSTQ